MSITLSELWVYPIKSLAGISIHQCEVTPRGLKHDRRWMVVNPDGVFMTQRKFPRMALLKTELRPGALVVTAAEMEQLVIPLDLEHPLDDRHATGSNRDTVVDVWGDRCLAWTVGKHAKEWFSDALGTHCELVYMPESSDRPVDHGKLGAQRQVSFADAYPYLLISQASLDDLNQRLEQPILMNRFRPNFVVSGCAPFAEDHWNDIRIGDVGFGVKKACSRCRVTTVDQATGQRGAEPLKTLATYRHWEGQIWFGQNLVHETLGMVAVGDRLEIFSSKISSN